MKFGGGALLPLNAALCALINKEELNLKGNCLCGEVSFELSGELPPIYQCHCSLCRKVSGSSSNSALIVEASNFKWRSGEHQIRLFST
ncbi:GFA family protein, partial [Vibrio parahaemolyticus]|uniref:GFA family protein n=1 Tax=Vibrio parahaemolyticus TaxID=670 RepID=UPI00356B72DB